MFGAPDLSCGCGNCYRARSIDPPYSDGRYRAMTRIRTSLALGLLLLAALVPTASHAADAVFPPGVRVGLVPIEGLAPASDFTGFITGDQKVKVGLAELPEAAFSSVDAALKDNKT